MAELRSSSKQQRMDSTAAPVNVQSLPLFCVNPDSQEFTIGLIYSGLALFIAPIYVVVLYVMLTDKEVTSNPQYRLMNQINLADFGQIIFHVLSGIYIIFPQIQIQYQFLVRISGSTANSLWLSMFPVMCALSISRIFVMKEIISPKHTSRTLTALTVIGWMYSIGVWLWGCITQNFMMADVGWSYDFTKLGATTLSALEWYLCFPSLGLSYIAYLIIVLHVHTTKKSRSNSSRGHEVRIFLQSTFLCAYMVTLIIMWHNAETWFEMSKGTIAILNSAWICFSYLNPLLLITLNKTIRQKVIHLLKCSKGPSLHSFSTTNKVVAAKTSRGISRS